MSDSVRQKDSGVLMNMLDSCAGGKIAQNMIKNNESGFSGMKCLNLLETGYISNFNVVGHFPMQVHLILEAINVRTVYMLVKPRVY